MKLVLITCCKIKADGGETEYKPSKALHEGLGAASYQRLMAARRELAELRDEDPGPDLGFEETTPGLTYLPAYRRYHGKMYKAARVKELYPVSRLRLIIISALYGLLDADDSIRVYDLCMKCKVDAITAARFWQQHGLGEIVCEYIHNHQPVEVHDLLSGDYLKAIKPWPDCRMDGFSVMAYRYPGQGSGAIWQRGEDLEKLLRDP